MSHCLVKIKALFECVSVCEGMCEMERDTIERGEIIQKLQILLQAIACPVVSWRLHHAIKDKMKTLECLKTQGYQ